MSSSADLSSEFNSGLRTSIEEPQAFILFCRIKASVYAVIAAECVLLAFQMATVVSAVAMGLSPYVLLSFVVMLALVAPLYLMYKGVQLEKSAYLNPYLISKIVEVILAVGALGCLLAGFGFDRDRYPEIFVGFVIMIAIRILFDMAGGILVIQSRRYFAEKDRFNYWNQPSFPYVVPMAPISSLSVQTPYDAELF